MTKLLSNSNYGVGATLVALLAVALAWATIGRLDIVVQAHGKLIPANFVQVAQPVEGGRLIALHVSDGEQVSAGTLLVELDATEARSELQAQETEQSRLRYLAEVQLALLARAPIPEADGSSEQQSVRDEYRFRALAYEDALAQAKAAVVKAERELTAGELELIGHKKVLSVQSAAKRRQQALVGLGMASQLQADDRESEYVAREHSLKTQAAANEVARAGLSLASASVAVLTSDYLKQLSAERNQALAALEKTSAAVSQLRHRVAQARLTSPIRGVVNGLSGRSTGQVVSAGTVLMSIVPHDAPLVAEVWVKNEDAGFAFPGLESTVKVSSFPFQKYGWVDGVVDWVGADAEVPESMKNAQGEPLFFKARIRLSRQALSRDGKTFPLRSGMQVSADMNIGTRSLFEYLTSPIKRAVLEAARER